MCALCRGRFASPLVFRCTILCMVLSLVRFSYSLVTVYQSSWCGRTDEAFRYISLIFSLHCCGIQKQIEFPIASTTWYFCDFFLFAQSNSENLSNLCVCFFFFSREFTNYFISLCESFYSKWKLLSLASDSCVLPLNRLASIHDAKNRAFYFFQKGNLLLQHAGKMKPKRTQSKWFCSRKKIEWCADKF